MAGLSPNAARFFKFLLILILFSLAMTIFNFLLACTFQNGGIAILLSALFNLFTMTFAGFCKLARGTCRLWHSCSGQLFISIAFPLS